MFPPNIFTPTPKIIRKPHFGGPFNVKPIIQRALRQSHVNGATTLKLYSYVGIVKYLGCVKMFPLRGVWGRRALNVNLGPPIILETTNMLLFVAYPNTLNNSTAMTLLVGSYFTDL